MRNFKTYIIVGIAALIVASVGTARAEKVYHYGEGGTKCDLRPNGKTPAESLGEAVEAGWVIETDSGYKASTTEYNLFLSRIFWLVFPEEQNTGGIIKTNTEMKSPLEYEAVTDEAKAKIHDLTCD